VRRIPQILVDFKPSYKASRFIAFGNVRYVGERFVDDANVATLPDYVELHAGVSYQLPRVTLALNAANLTNTIGLTEGNPRVGQVIGTKQDIYMARPILGRAMTFAVAYSF
jgi:outer membrane receptor protein involved in Fe transport